MKKYFRKSTYKNIFRDTLIATILILAIFGFKIWWLGVEPPTKDDGMIKYYLKYTLIPTPIPPVEIELNNTKKELEIAENNQRYLRHELASRGDILDREQKRKEIIIKVINKNLWGKMSNKGEAIYMASTTHGYPPYLQAAIIKQESGHGANPRSSLYSHNNPGGIFAGDHLRWYDTVEQGIWDMAERIKRYYVAEGKTDIRIFGQKYCPVGAKNDPTGLNKHWVPNVTNYYIKMLNESEGLI